MKNLLYTMMFVFAASLPACHSQAATSYTLVKNNKPTSVIVAPASPPDFVQDAIDELQYHLQRASGVTLKVMDKKAAAALPTDTVRIMMEAGNLPVEAYSIKSDGNRLTFTGDGGKSDALQWAVDHYLDTQLGVLWLWPGDVGTYVPECNIITLPEIDYRGRPALEKRNFRFLLAKARSYKGSPTFLSDEEYKNVLEEGHNWLVRFQNGSRSHYRFGHAFTDWWEKYGKDHPAYFAMPPQDTNYQQPWPSPPRVKLRVSNEAVDKAIIAEWKAAGAPNNWPVCPNDSAGFDTSPATLAMDYPPNQDPMLIWKTAKANLTARYVKFWNRLMIKMRKINPNVTLSSYAYSAYRNAPLNGLNVQDGIVLGLVPSYWAQENWRNWQEAGAMLYLRPNWWHTGGVAPMLPLHKQGQFFKFAQSHNMIGFDFDSLMGYWATQGPMYYVIARLSLHPQMSVDDVINEYCSAFGDAAPEIKKYLSYWEDFTKKAAFPVPAGGAVKPDQPGLVSAITEKYNLTKSPTAQGWAVLPYLYTDGVLRKGYAILDQAAHAAADDSDLVKKRIQFLRDGLDHLKLTRDVLKLGYMDNRSAQQQQQFQTLAAELEQMRHRLTLQHVIWGESEYKTEKRRHAPTYPEAK